MSAGTRSPMRASTNFHLSSTPSTFPSNIASFPLAAHSASCCAVFTPGGGCTQEHPKTGAPITESEKAANKPKEKRMVPPRDMSPYQPAIQRICKDHTTSLRKNHRKYDHITKHFDVLF